MAQSRWGRKIINSLPNKVQNHIYKKIKNQWAFDKSNNSLEKTQSTQSKQKQSQSTQSTKDGEPKKTVDSSQESRKFIESQFHYNEDLMVN